MIKKILLTLIIIILLLFGVYRYGERSATALPDNNPEAFLQSGNRGNRKVVVCIGDSITHGRVSYNYVDELAGRLPENEFILINAGINSELAWNVLQRLDPIIRSKPDYITLLIGTNDVLATLNEKHGDHYIEKWQLPQRPDKQWYEKNLRSIIQHMQKETEARIALLSLPPITEDQNHTGFKRAIEYSEIVKKTADDFGLAYLGLGEKLNGYLQKSSGQPSDFVAGENMQMYSAIFTHYLLGKSWNDIAGENGYNFLTDNIHLNGKGAGIIADLVEEFIRE